MGFIDLLKPNDIVSTRINGYNKEFMVLNNKTIQDIKSKQVYNIDILKNKRKAKIVGEQLTFI